MKQKCSLILLLSSSSSSLLLSPSQLSSSKKFLESVAKYSAMMAYGDVEVRIYSLCSWEPDGRESPDVS
jgi:hypothetical protein